MISLSYLNKLILFVIIFIAVFLDSSLADDEPADIWQNNETETETTNQISNLMKMRSSSSLNV